MGFLHKLWDETLAGPAPETGLGKLRKYDSFSARSSSSSEASAADDTMMISRSITILRSNSSNFRNFSGNSLPASPAASTATATPLSPGTPVTPRGNFKKLTRRKSPTEALEHSEHRSPTVYDWIVITALDR